MTFLSWAGCSITEAVAAEFPKDRLDRMAMRSIQAVDGQHVIRRNMRGVNMLFSKRLMA